MIRFAFLAAILWVAPIFAGHSAPSFIDGGQSVDGRFVVVAEPVGPIKDHGPNQWEFIWKDTKAKTEARFPAKEVQPGQIYAQLFVAPDGETFALFNAVQLAAEAKHDSHKGTGREVYERGDPAFAKRLIVYRKDGSVLKQVATQDVQTPAEWAGTMVVFNRVHWIAEYPGMSFRNPKTPRTSYAFYRISPDYTVLEVRIAPKGARVVRFDLTTGEVIPPEKWSSDSAKVPVRPYIDPVMTPEQQAEKHIRDRFRPSLDPVRSAGDFAPPKVSSLAPEKSAAPVKDASPAAPGKLELVAGGYKKADTPTWLPREKCLVFVDLDKKTLYRVDPPKTVAKALEGTGRGKVGPDGCWYGIVNGALSSWKPGELPKVILEKAPDGRDWEVNDLAISAAGIAYITTLKDPDKGRLTMVDLNKMTGSVLFDGEKDADFVNPNGVALSPDGKHLYVGISSYADRKKSCVYHFPVGADGMPDVALGKKQRFADVTAPDGIAVDQSGTVYFTAGGVVKVFGADGKARPDLKIPKGSGTNLGFGGSDGQTLFVTTNEAVYSCPIKISTSSP